MELRINKDRLSIESMKKIIELVDSGVLIDIEKEFIEGIKKVPEVVVVDEAGLFGDYKIAKKPRRKGKNAVWTEADERKLMLLRRQGFSPKDIAAKLKVTPKDVYNKINNLKIAGRLEEESGKKPTVKTHTIKTKNPYFTKEMKDLLVMLKEERYNLSYPYIAKRLNKKFGRNLTAQQVKEKYKKIRR